MVNTFDAFNGEKVMNFVGHFPPMGKLSRFL